MAELKVKVEAVLYPKQGAESEWKIIKTEANGVIKGNLSWTPEPGELLLIEGNYGTYQGKSEFKFTSARAFVPVDPRDQLHYLCEITPGFGQSMEQRIWDAWGELWSEKAEPGIVKGLKGERFDNFCNALDNIKLKREESEAVTWLMSIGCTINAAQKAWERWGKQAIGVVKADCYSLADLPHYGFVYVDKSIRHAFQISDTDPRRIRVGIFYSIKQLTEQGSTLVNWYALKDEITRNLGAMGVELINEQVRRMFDLGELVAFKRNYDLATAEDYENEKIIWEFVNK